MMRPLVCKKSIWAKGLIPGLVAALLAALAAPWSAPAAEGGVKVRLGTLMPKGSSSYKHLQAMGEKWRQAQAAAWR